MLANPLQLPTRRQHAGKSPQSVNGSTIAATPAPKSKLQRWIANVSQALSVLVIAAIFLPVILCMYAAYYLHQSD